MRKLNIPEVAPYTFIYEDLSRVHDPWMDACFLFVLILFNRTFGIVSATIHGFLMLLSIDASTAIDVGYLAP